MNTIEVKAKTVHEAIEEAVDKLGLPQEDLDIEILEQGGMFKKCCVRATVKQSATKPAEKIPPVEIKTPAREPKSGAADNSFEKRGPGEAPKDVRSRPSFRSDEKEISSQPRNNSCPKFTKTTDFVTKLLKTLDNDSTVKTELTDNSFNINVTGENIGQLIGKNGMVLNALQTLVSSIAISNSDGERTRVFVNIGDYRERRGDSLQSLARKKADYVKSSGRQVKLDPMNARERAIIHTILADIDGIKTYSTGKDPFRCLCIAPADKS